MKIRQGLSDHKLARRRDEHDDARPAKRPDPAKLISSDLDEATPWTWAGATPGKLTLADVGREQMSPANALAYADSLLRVEVSANDEHDDRGAMASAFSFVDEAAPKPRRLGGLEGDQLPAALYDAARRLQRAAKAADPRVDQMIADLRDAVARAFRDGFGTPANDERAAAELDLIDPNVAYGALAVHGVSDAIRRTGRLAARVNDGGSLDDRPDTLSAITTAGNEPGEPLPPDVLARLEAQLGRPLGHVRIHTGSAANTAARAINERAVTLGSHIYFADGELAPGTDRGDRLLRHELTHVVQHDEGRLRSKSGGLEVEDYDGAAETEARAAESGTPAPRAPAATGPSTPSTGKGAIGRNIFGDAYDAGANLVGNVYDKGAEIAGDVAEWTADKAIWIVEQVSPELARMIRNGPEGTILDEVKKIAGDLLGHLIPGNPLAALGVIAGGISDLGSVLVGAATGDAKCCETFAGWCKSIGSFARKAASSQFVKNVKAAFGAIDTAVGWVIRFFGGAFVEAFRGQMQFLDTIAGWMGDALRAVAAVTTKALDWALKQLNLPSVTAIGTWLQGLAEKAWDKIKEGVAAGVAVLKEIGPIILAFTGIGPIIDAFKFSMELIEVTDWLIAHRSDPDLVKHAREQMSHTFLPKLIDDTAKLREKLSAAYEWCKDALGKVRDILVKAAPYLVGLLLPLAPILIPVAVFVSQLWPKIVPVLQSLWTDIKALAKRIYDYAKPVIEVFLVLGRLIAMPWMLPMVLASVAWLALPECLKPPIIDLILDLMIAALEMLPDSNVLFGPMWRFLKSGTIGFLKKVQTGWTPDLKVTVINRMARLASGASVDAMAGFVVGFFKGLVAGVLDPFKMIYELLKIGWDLSVFFAKLVNHAPQLAKVIEKHLPDLQKNAAQIAAAGKQALDDFLAGKIGFDDLWKLLGTFMDKIDAAAASLGATVADKLQAFFTGGGTEYDIAEAIGIAIGFIVVFALIVYFSGGAYAEAEGAVGVVAQIARILNMPYELMGAALKPLAKLFGPVIEALSALGSRLGLKAVWDGALKAFERFVEVLGRLVEDIILAIEGKFVERTAEEIVAILGRRIGADLAAKLVTDLGEKAAQEVVAKLGEKNIARLGSLSADALLQLSVKLDEATLTRMLDAGWTPAIIERLGLALDKPAIDALLASGVSGAQLERLAALSAEKLQGQSAASLRRIAALPEDQFLKLNALSDTGFHRIVSLPEAQFNRFASLGEEQLRFFSELSDEGLARFEALADADFAQFAAMDATNLQRFAAMNDAQFAVASGTKVIADQAYLDAVAAFKGVPVDEITRFYEDMMALGIDHNALIDAVLAKYPTLTRAEADAIFGYTTKLYYRDLNHILNAGGSPEAAELSQILEKGLASMPPAAPIQYRGLRLGSPAEIAAFDAEYQVGEIIETHAYWSTGPTPGAAYAGGRNLVIHTTAAKDISELAFGVHFHPLVGKPPYPSEAIIPPGIRFRVVSVDPATGTVVLEQI